MTFLHPFLAAAAVAGISIPILIHILMRRRRKPVMWAAMQFLLEAYRQQRRRLRLEQLLLLAARCLLILLAGLAIARPLLGGGGVLGGRGAATLYLLIDNGLASSATASLQASDTALARHKAAADSLLNQLDAGAGDRAGLIALGGPAQAMVVPASTGLGSVREAVRELSSVESATDIAGALAALRPVLAAGSADSAGRTIVAVLSDFLAGSADTQRALSDLAGPGVNVVVLASRPAELAPANTAITGLEPLQPVLVAPRGETGPRQSPVRITLSRSGEGLSQTASTRVRFTVDAPGAPRPAAAGETVVRWAAGQAEATATASVQMSISGGGALVLTASIDADAIAGDNTWRRPIEARQSLRVGLIAPRRTGAARPGLNQYEPEDWFRLALQPMEARAGGGEVEVTEIEPGALDAPRLAGLDAAIVTRPESLPDGSWRRLRAFADAGGLILVCPPPQATVHLWADPMVRDMGLPWTIAREARVLPEGGSAISVERSAVSRDMLSMLDAELQELAAPVRVFRVLPVELAVKGSAVLELAGGIPLVAAAAPGSAETAQGEPVGRGLVVMLAAALAFEWTDLQAKPLMVALTQELIRQGIGRARGTYTDLAGATPTLPARTVELRPVAEGAAAIRAAAGRASEPIRRAGIYRAVDEIGAARGLVAVNADPAAGRSTAQPATAIAAWLRAATPGREVAWVGGDGAQSDPVEGGGGGVRAALEGGEDAGRLALPLLIAALALAVLELAMARWFSHATTGGVGGAPS